MTIKAETNPKKLFREAGVLYNSLLNRLFRQNRDRDKRKHLQLLGHNCGQKKEKKKKKNVQKLQKLQNKNSGKQMINFLYFFSFFGVPVYWFTLQAVGKSMP